MASAVPAGTCIVTCSSSAAPAAFPLSGHVVGLGLSRCPVPAPPVGPHTSVHRRSSGIHVGGLVFVGITVVPSGVHLPTFLKRNCWLKDFHPRAQGWRHPRRWHQRSPARSCHLMSGGHQPGRAPQPEVRPQTSFTAKPGTSLLSHQGVLPKLLSVTLPWYPATWRTVYSLLSAATSRIAEGCYHVSPPSLLD